VVEPIPFIKMNGCGNDFILIDSRSAEVPRDLVAFTRRVCRRKLSAGADGLILIEPSDRYDFQWQFYNSDGSRAEMCGNGARCAARFAYEGGIAGQKMVFKTDAGPIEAEMRGEQVKLKMTPPADCRIDFTIDLPGEKRTLSSINTGVPHVVLEQDGLSDADIVPLGREIRYHEAFAPAGTNVNFVFPAEGERLQVRTYERGVEDETLACGTGCVAAALVTAARRGWSSPIPVATRSGGILTIYFKKAGDQFSEAYLEGDARIVYRGTLQPDALLA
jgi:diaminopimelate epimerase